MDSLRSERPASDALTGAERDARIEQLLLTGLDHYFAGDYDQAINLWTRVLFLDRGHDRARAYIERARSAQAERQRESEALIHEGLDALTRGDVAQARELVAEALAKGASRDLALGVLDRIERLGVLPVPVPQPTRSAAAWLKVRTPVAPARDATPAVPHRGRGWVGVLLLVFAAIGVVALALGGLTLPGLDTWPFTGVTRRAAPAVTAHTAEPLPVPAATELYLSRGRAFFDSGRLRDALRELDRIPVGDATRAEADHLRGEIQDALLASAFV